MEEKLKLYDQILTEGARWLAVLQKEHGPLFIKDESLNKSWYICFLEIARVASNYGIDFYINAPWYRRFYLCYIKRFKFLKRPLYTDGYEIDAWRFMEELLTYFKQPCTIYEEIQNTYYGGKKI